MCSPSQMAAPLAVSESSIGIKADLLGQGKSIAGECRKIRGMN